jgi:hypothetical protein
MGILNKKFREGDVYVKYDQEEVMFHYDHKTKKCFRKFVGDKDEEEVPSSNKLLTDSILYGDEIDSKEYKA